MSEKAATKLEVWPDPTPEMLEEPLFEAIWQCIKTWDINVPGVYQGYSGATGNHVRAILEGVYPVFVNELHNVVFKAIVLREEKRDAADDDQGD